MRSRVSTSVDQSVAPPVDPSEPVRTTSHLDKAHRRTRFNQYRCEAKIGKGKHGEVYLCEDRNVAGRKVALKVVHRNNRRDKMKLLRRNYQLTEGSGKPPPNSTENSIRKEIAIMKKCRHAHLVRLLEVIDDPNHDKIYIAMEYIPGGPVEWANTSHEPILTLEQSRRIIRDVILGLEYLHSQGIIHRDIKPANLIYSKDRSYVKIIDFGVAHFTPPAYSTRRKQIPHDLEMDAALFPETDLLKRTGTPSFLAPEVVWFSDDTVVEDPVPGARVSVSSIESSQSRSSATIGGVSTSRPPITKAIDIWSLAVTFYCFLFGRTPFTVPATFNENVHHNEFMLYHQICTQDWLVPETLGAERVPTGGRRPKDSSTEGYIIINMLDRMLQKRPENRISLLELKQQPWFLQNISNPREWLRLTSPLPSQQLFPCEWTRIMSSKLAKLIPGLH